MWIRFFQAARLRKEAESFVVDGFVRLLRSQVVDFRSTWPACSKKFANSPEFLKYCEVFGRDKAQNFFRRHVKKLKDDVVARKLQSYFDRLPQVFLDFFPDLDMIVAE